jgi:hypothetical protein
LNLLVRIAETRTMASVYLYLWLYCFYLSIQAVVAGGQAAVNRFFNRYLFLGLVVSTGSILVFAHGVFGLGSTFTGLYILCSMGSLFLFDRPSGFWIEPCDFVFGLLLTCIAISFAKNSESTNAKEIELLVLSLCAYPASRLITYSDRSNSTFIWVTAIVVYLGVFATIPALIEQWTNHHGKPYVFGEFDAAPLQFLSSLGFLVIAMVCSDRLTYRRALLISALISLPAAIFAASMVRFTFIAIGCGLTLAAVMGAPKDRKYVGAVALALCVAISVGLLARSDATLRSLSLDVAGLSSPATVVVASAEPSAPVSVQAPEGGQAGLPGHRSGQLDPDPARVVAEGCGITAGRGNVWHWA